jgi:hypothetical protein
MLPIGDPSELYLTASELSTAGRVEAEAEVGAIIEITISTIARPFFMLKSLKDETATITALNAVTAVMESSSNKLLPRGDTLPDVLEIIEISPCRSEMSKINDSYKFISTTYPASFVCGVHPTLMKLHSIPQHKILFGEI